MKDHRKPQFAIFYDAEPQNKIKPRSFETEPLDFYSNKLGVNNVSQKNLHWRHFRNWNGMFPILLWLLSLSIWVTAVFIPPPPPHTHTHTKKEQKNLPTWLTFFCFCCFQTFEKVTNAFKVNRITLNVFNIHMLITELVRDQLRVLQNTRWRSCSAHALTMLIVYQF